MTDRAYARISLDTAASGSITKQRSRLGRFADGEPVFYVDESVSGSKVPFADRPAGSALLGDLEHGDRVLVTKIDRAARNVRDLLDLVERVEAAGASIVFVDQNIDTAGPMGRFLLTLLGAIAELEAGIIAERRRESLAAFREEGRHAVGRAPFGLQAVPNPSGRGLVLRPDPEEAPILRDAVESILAGESQRAWSARCGMQHPAFGRLLRNERLAGVLGYDGDGSLRLDPDQAVFTLAEWRRLQEHLQRCPARRQPRRRTEGYGPALACGVCGDRLYFNASARRPEYATYRCRKVKHGPMDPGVTVIRVNADRVVEADFLTRFGGLPVFERITTDSSAVRDEAVARARLQIEAVRAAQDRAETDEEEEEAFGAYLRAKRALRAAEALPTSAVTEEIPTGETFAQVWESSDDEARTDLLLRFGPWVVEPGRLPIEEKISLPEREPDYLAGQTD
jgi:DNA invertase Pin-like site-specific DNA recombinase